MNDSAAPNAEGLVLQLEDGPSYWQPVPANGHVTAKLTPANWDGPFSCGIQVVAPGGHIRRHIHDRHLEAVFVWGGQGRAVVDGVEHKLTVGTLVALPTGVEHMFINDGDEPLQLFWILSPHGIEEFFRLIGRPRSPGEPAPDPFPRPADVLEIEARTVFKPGSTL